MIFCLREIARSGRWFKRESISSLLIGPNHNIRKFILNLRANNSARGDLSELSNIGCFTLEMFVRVNDFKWLNEHCWSKKMFRFFGTVLF